MRNLGNCWLQQTAMLGWSPKSLLWFLLSHPSLPLQHDNISFSIGYFSHCALKNHPSLTSEEEEGRTSEPSNTLYFYWAKVSRRATCAKRERDELKDGRSYCGDDGSPVPINNWMGIPDSLILSFSFLLFMLINELRMNLSGNVSYFNFGSARHFETQDQEDQGIRLQPKQWKHNPA